MTTSTENKVYQSAWGFHPCDKDTYIKLRKLNYWFLKAQIRAAEWNRWERKDEQNRVIRKFIRNDRGQKIGCKIVGPKPEPKTECPFCEFWSSDSDNNTFHRRYGCERTPQSHWINKGDLKVNDFWTAENGERYYYHTGLYVDSFGIDLDYQNAKRPRTEEDVQPLKNSVEQINALYKKVLEWESIL